MKNNDTDSTGCEIQFFCLYKLHNPCCYYTTISYKMHVVILGISLWHNRNCHAVGRYDGPWKTGI